MGSLACGPQGRRRWGGGTPLFDASERPHRRQDNLQGSIANSLLVKLAGHNAGHIANNVKRVQKQKIRASARILAAQLDPISPKPLSTWE